MISDATLDLAVDRGILSPDQAVELRGLEALTSDDAFTIDAISEAPIGKDDEEIRLVGSFGDVFVTLGLALFLAPLAYVVNKTFGMLAMWVALLVASWLLAEFFTLRRRLALPSIVLLGVFVVAAFFACFELAAFLLTDPHPPVTQHAWWHVPGFSDVSTSSVTTGLAALLSLGLIVPHWLRFHVPVTIAAGAAVLSLATFSFGHRLADITPQAATFLLLACGLLVFALAMHFDLADRRRVTQRADVAFWLHLLAAPMIVHPVMSLFGGDASAWNDPNAATLILVVFVILALVALVIDRRALLLSGLVYAGAAISALVGASGLTGTLIPVAALALGVLVLALSAGWRPLRNAILRVLPRTLVQKLPYPTGAQAL
jgi:hypothetical protein